MKPRNLIFILLSFTFILSLTACSGQMTATSWPGFTVHEGKVYLSFQTGVYAINLDNGTMLWKAPETPDTKRNYYAAPLPTGDQLIVGDYLNSLHGLNLSSGTESWKFETTNGRFISSVAVSGDGTILAGASDNYFYALDNEANLKWKFKTSAANWAQPAIDGETAFLPSMDHYLYSVDINSGNLLWKVDLGGAVIGGVSMDGDRLYLGTLANEVLAVNKVDGSVAWREKTDGAIWAVPTLKDGRLFFGDTSSTVYALDAQSGVVSWRMTEIGGPIVGSAGVTDRGVIFVTEDGKMTSLDLNGQRQWEKQLTGKLYSNPVVAVDLVILGINDGDTVLKAFDYNGSERWSFAIPK